jgi:hypothetical protein
MIPSMEDRRRVIVRCAIGGRGNEFGASTKLEECQGYQTGNTAKTRSGVATTIANAIDQ